MKRLANYKPPMRPGPVPKYPWDTWLDGKHIYRLKHGQDFHTATLDAMVEHIRRTAKNRGIKVSVHLERDNDSIVIVPQGRKQRNGKKATS